VAPIFSLGKWLKFQSAIKCMFDRPICVPFLEGRYGHVAFQYSRGIFLLAIMNISSVGRYYGPLISLKGGDV